MNQLEFEQQIIERGISKKVEMIQAAHDRAEAGSDIRSVANKIFISTFKEVHEKFIQMLSNDMQTIKKTTFYREVYMPIMQQYDKLFLEKKLSEASHPQDVVPYIMTEMICYSVLRERHLTETGLQTLNHIKAAYGNYLGNKEDDVKGLQGTLQYLYTILESLTKFEVASKEDSSKYIRVIHEADALDLSKMVEEATPAITYYPMFEVPNDHSGLYDPTGGYQIIESPIMKRRPSRFVMDNQDCSVVETVNRMQKVAYTINTEFQEFLMNLDIPEVKILNDSTMENIAAARNTVKILEKRIMSLIKSQEYDKIDAVRDKLAEVETSIGQMQSYKRTIDDSAIFAGHTFYHPMFTDTRSRYYYYNSSLSPQSGSLAKSILELSNKQKITKEGFRELIIYTVGMCSGYSKTKEAGRIAFYCDKLEPLIKRGDFIQLTKYTDSDDMFVFLSAVWTLNKYYNNPEYETGFIVYVDAASSAIQTAALLQRCKKSAILTSMSDNGLDTMSDAYKEAASLGHDMVSDIAKQSDAALLANLMTYIQKTDPKRFAGFDYRLLVS